MYQHFKAVATAVDIPQIVYNVPGRTVVDMCEDTVSRLADIDNIVAIKDATGNLERGISLIRRVGERMVVLSGDDPAALELIKIWLKGDISVTSNIAPKAMSQAFGLALEGHFEEAYQIHDTIVHLHRDLFIESSPQPVKYALHKMGKIGTGIRLPMVWLAEHYHETIDNSLKKQG